MEKISLANDLMADLNAESPTMNRKISVLRILALLVLRYVKSLIFRAIHSPKKIISTLITRPSFLLYYSNLVSSSIGLCS